MKVYRIIYDFGMSRYAVSFHDGEKMHRDGSPFFDINLFSNRRKFERRVRELEKLGYVRE